MVYLHNKSIIKQTEWIRHAFNKRRYQIQSTFWRIPNKSARKMTNNRKIHSTFDHRQSEFIVVARSTNTIFRFRFNATTVRWPFTYLLYCVWVFSVWFEFVFRFSDSSTHTAFVGQTMTCVNRLHLFFTNATLMPTVYWIVHRFRSVDSLVGRSFGKMQLRIWLARSFRHRFGQ